MRAMGLSGAGRSHIKATVSGKLSPIPDCYIKIPGPNKTSHTVVMRSLPDISDSKSAVYNSEAIMGRSFPMYTYSHSADRNLSVQLHYFVTEPGDAVDNLQDLRWLQSAVYPRE